MSLWDGHMIKRGAVLMIAMVLLAGCDSGPLPTDDGPRYVAPAGTNAPIAVPGHDLDYEYVATTQRAQQIRTGYDRLHVGATREEVRAALGPPDTAMVMHPRDSNRFIGFMYTYKVRTTKGMSRTYDEYVAVYFDRSHRLSETLTRIPGLSNIGQRKEQ
jgi:hypothetical protein